MQRLIANIYLMKPITDILPESFKRFLSKVIDMGHKKNALFPRSLLHVYMDSLDSIIAYPNIIDNDDFSLYNDMRNSLLLKNQTNH